MHPLSEPLPSAQRLFPSQITYRKNVRILSQIEKALIELNSFPLDLERAIIRFSKDPSRCEIILVGKEFFREKIQALIALSNIFLESPRYATAFTKGTSISKEVLQKFESSSDKSAKTFFRILGALKNQGKKQAEPATFSPSPGPSRPHKRKHGKIASQPN